MKDRFGRKIDYMRISVTELCNLRCRYCMPAEGIVKRSHDDMLSAEEIVDAVRAAASLGIRKIRLTGGEPLVKRGITELCSRIAAVDGIEELCMTTNGVLLPRYSRELKAAGVDRLNISLDTLDRDKYRSITRLGDISDVFRGIEAAFDAGFSRLKINTVLIGGFNDDEIRKMAGITRYAPLDVRFIELMPIGESIDLDDGRFLSSQKVLEEVPELQPLDTTEGVASMYRLPGAAGRVGLIRTISCDFCGGCNKIRLTSDGMLKPCLHCRAELSIKGLDQSGMLPVIRRAIYEKPYRRGALDAHNPSLAGRNMNSIGG